MRVDRLRAGALVAALLVATCSSAGAEPRGLAEQWAGAIASGRPDAIAKLYHEEGSHRDLATGELARGAEQLERLLAARLGGSAGAANRPRVAGIVALGTDAAIVRLVIDAPTAGWPAYTALLLTRVEGRWAVAASRAGGNPDAGP